MYNIHILNYILYYTILSYIFLYYPIVSYIFLYYLILSYVILYYPILTYIILYYPTFIILYIVLSFIILYVDKNEFKYIKRDAMITWCPGIRVIQFKCYWRLCSHWLRPVRRNWSSKLDKRRDMLAGLSVRR